MRRCINSPSHRLILGLILFLPATTASGQEQAVPPRQPAEELILGDGYVVDVERGSLRRRFEGTLVKANEQWIVLRVVSEGRNEVAVPVVSKAPYFGKRLFQNVGIGRQTEFRWIPREAATIAGHVHAEKPQPATDFADEAPQKGSRFNAFVAAEGKIVEQDGDLAEKADEAIVYMSQRRVYEMTVVPLFGELPFVGGAFRKTKARTEFVRTEIPRESLLCLCTYELDGEEATIELVPDTE